MRDKVWLKTSKGKNSDRKTHLGKMRFLQSQQQIRAETSDP